MAYTGPGNIQSGWKIWCGLRGYNTAAANGITKSVRIQRASDSTSQDFVILSTGAVDVSSIATFLASTTGIITTWYDQSGNGFDVTLASGTGATYTLGATGLGAGQPCGALSGSGAYTNTSGEPFGAQPFTLSGVSNRTGALTTTQIILSNAGEAVQLAYNNANNQGYQYAGTVQTFTISDSTWHTINAIYNGASSSVNVDGASVSSANPGATGGGFQFFGMSSAGSPLTAQITEFGLLEATLTSPSSLNTNQQYWFSAIPSGVTPATLMSQICM